MSDFNTVLSTGSVGARLGLARSLLSRSSEHSTTSDTHRSRNSNDAALLLLTAILAKLNPRRASTVGTVETGGHIATTTSPVSASRVSVIGYNQPTNNVAVSQDEGSSLASLIDSVTELVHNKDISPNDPPTPIPYIVDQRIRTSIQALGYTHPHPVNVAKLCHRLARSLLDSPRDISNAVPKYRSSSPARAITLNFRLDDLDEYASASLTRLFNAFPTDSAMSSPRTNNTDSPVSSPRSESVLDLTTEDSATAPTDSPLTSPSRSSEDIPSNGIKQVPNGKARNVLLDHVRYTPRSKEFPRARSMTSASQSSYSSPAQSIRPLPRGRFYSLTQNTSLLSLCPSISSSTNPQGEHPIAATNPKGISTTAITPSVKSTMGSFTPVSKGTASGSLRASQSTKTNQQGPLSWLVEKLKTEFTTEWHEEDDLWDVVDSDCEELDRESTSSDDGYRHSLPQSATVRRLSMKRSGNEIPSLCLTQSTFTQPSPLSALFVPPTPPKQRKPSFSSPPLRSTSPTPPGKRGGESSLRKQMLEGRAAQSATRSQTLPMPRATPTSIATSPLLSSSPSKLSSSPRRCATSPPTSLDPALAALEKKCRLNTMVRCSNCQTSGRNFPTARNGDTFCSRECRIALKEKNSVAKGKGKAPRADLAVF